MGQLGWAGWKEGSQESQPARKESCRGSREELLSAGGEPVVAAASSRFASERGGQSQDVPPPAPGNPASRRHHRSQQDGEGIARGARVRALGWGSRPGGVRRRGKGAPKFSPPFCTKSLISPLLFLSLPTRSWEKPSPLCHPDRDRLRAPDGSRKSSERASFLSKLLLSSGGCSKKTRSLSQGWGGRRLWQKSGFEEKGREEDAGAMPGTGPRDRLL